MDTKELVRLYGGQSLLARRLGIGQSAVAYWVKKGAIPSKWHEKMLEIAQKEGINIRATDLLAVDIAANSKAEIHPQSVHAANFGNPTIQDANVSAIQKGVISGSEQFLFYAADSTTIKVQVLLGEDTVWATQRGISEIFDTSRENITIHLKNIFESSELDENSVCKESLLSADDGKQYITKVYNLDAIISVGYRVNSYKATQFRRWATTVLKEYLIKGFALDDDRLKQGSRLFGKDYFDELLERIREIRASERRFYQRVTDIYRECSIDYDPNSPITRQFYAHVQDKLHFAVHGHTSAELVMIRADATKPNMGLTCYKNDNTGGKITRLDVKVGKNYLTEEEINELNRLVSMYLDWAEGFARRHIPMTMMDWTERLDGFLSFNAYDVLEGYGKVKRDDADKHALAQFEKYRVIQDKEYKSDFDKIVEEIKINNSLPRKNKPS